MKENISSPFQQIRWRSPNTILLGFLDIAHYFNINVIPPEFTKMGTDLLIAAKANRFLDKFSQFLLKQICAFSICLNIDIVDWKFHSLQCKGCTPRYRPKNIFILQTVTNLK